MNKVTIQFLKGINEVVVPEIRLTKNKTGNSGQAIFRFNNPSILASDNIKDIQFMSLLDEEGVIQTSEINISVSRKDGKYIALEAIYCWKTKEEFNRFMRFAKRYANKNNLFFEES